LWSEENVLPIQSVAGFRRDLAAIAHGACAIPPETRAQIVMLPVPGEPIAATPAFIRATGTASRNAMSTRSSHRERRKANMSGIIYLVGLIVVIMAVLSFFGLH
jgi:hypothetical protein